MPVNLRTHAHGQGYTDLNFIIPELISGVDYTKGPYYANVGDFGSAGAAFIRYSDGPRAGLALGMLGDCGYQRALLIGSAPLATGTFTYGLEYPHSDGAWEVPNEYHKLNAMQRWFVPIGEGTLGITAMGYDGRWNSTDQVPPRAIDSGLIGRYGTLDASDGGMSSRLACRSTNAPRSPAGNARPPPTTTTRACRASRRRARRTRTCIRAGRAASASACPIASEGPALMP